MLSGLAFCEAPFAVLMVGFVVVHHSPIANRRPRSVYFSTLLVGIA